MLNRLYEIEHRALNAVAAPTNIFLNQSHLVGAFTCSKNINDCPDAALYFIVYNGQSFIFFAPMPSLYPCSFNTVEGERKNCRQNR
jgi:hypothetical protein